MISYAESDVFNYLDVCHWRSATNLVAALDLPSVSIPEVRCHELARAVGRILGLPHTDGRYGYVEHTWLRLGEWTNSDNCKILDVYVPGGIPQVQLIHYCAMSLPWRDIYRQGVEYERHDVDAGIVDSLVNLMTKKVPLPLVAHLDR